MFKAWQEIKEYLEWVLYEKPNTKALEYTSTSEYLQPFINELEEKLKKLAIIKEIVDNATWLNEEELRNTIKEVLL